MAVQIQIRRGDAADWTSADPTLAEGELGVELDTGKFKIGNGADEWTALTYAVGDNGDDGIDGATWLSGSSDPTTEGSDGDFYLNTTSCDVFKKVSGSWGTALLNIKGADGEDGATVTVVDNLTSTSTTSALSANQGKVLKDAIDACGGFGEAELFQLVRNARWI